MRDEWTWEPELLLLREVQTTSLVDENGVTHGGRRWRRGYAWSAGPLLADCTNRYDEMLVTSALVDCLACMACMAEGYQ